LKRGERGREGGGARGGNSAKEGGCTHFPGEQEGEKKRRKMADFATVFEEKGGTQILNLTRKKKKRDGPFLGRQGRGEKKRHCFRTGLKECPFDHAGPEKGLHSPE